MKNDKLFGVIAISVILLIAMSFVLWLSKQVEANVKELPVMQEQCAYPVRPLNPDGSCDNSDPCDPTRIKIDGGKCVDEPKPAKKETGQPINRFSDPEVTEFGK